MRSGFRCGHAPGDSNRSSSRKWEFAALKGSPNTRDPTPRATMSECRACRRDVGPRGRKVDLESGDRANGSRRSADVVVTFEFWRYFRFRGELDQRNETGVCFFRGDGVQIINYPRQHAENCTAKLQGTRRPSAARAHPERFRGWLVDAGRLADGVVPSYFVEGLSYNVPAPHVSGSYGNMLCQCFSWLQHQSLETPAQSRARSNSIISCVTIPCVGPRQLPDVSRRRRSRCKRRRPRVRKHEK